MPPTPARALVVDDSPMMRRVGARLLERLGYQCDLAEDGADGVACFDAGQHELVLLDVEMPHLDGIEATRQLRRIGGDPTRPWIVVMTGAAWEGVRERASEAGANAFLEKPVDLDSLRQALAGAPAPGSDPDDGPVDLAAFEDLVALGEGGPPRFIPDLLDAFIRDSESLVERIERAAAAGDLWEVYEAAHAFCGSSATMGARELQGICRTLERAARESSPLDSIVSDLRPALARAGAAWAARMGSPG